MKKCMAICSILAGIAAVIAGIAFLCIQKKHHGFYYSARIPIMDDDLPIMGS